MYSFDDFERLNSSVRMEMNNMFASITTEDKRMAEQMRHKFLNEIESSSELLAKEFAEHSVNNHTNHLITIFTSGVQSMISDVKNRTKLSELLDYWETKVLDILKQSYDPRHSASITKVSLKVHYFIRTLNKLHHLSL